MEPCVTNREIAGLRSMGIPNSARGKSCSSRFRYRGPGVSQGPRLRVCRQLRGMQKAPQTCPGEVFGKKRDAAFAPGIPEFVRSVWRKGYPIRFLQRITAPEREACAAVRYHPPLSVRAERGQIGSREMQMKFVGVIGRPWQGLFSKTCRIGGK